ncbi:hypothetical protein ElyMa_006136900 [Elysia marginata]|uniref:Uncharacterized protein n=1 Tax=Elysia marginata TaxID=1093978 RepID=A0AAV4GXM3_9GAST|nr:hypothetical protein ElyMa_006136900 [Elysia marginata]
MPLESEELPAENRVQMRQPDTHVNGISDEIMRASRQRYPVHSMEIVHNIPFPDLDTIIEGSVTVSPQTAAPLMPQQTSTFVSHFQAGAYHQFNDCLYLGTHFTDGRTKESQSKLLSQVAT